MPRTITKTRTKSRSSRTRSRGIQSKVRKAMHEWKQGRLRMGRSGKRVAGRRQAVAIGLSQGRRMILRRRGRSR